MSLVLVFAAVVAVAASVGAIVASVGASVVVVPGVVVVGGGSYIWPTNPSFLERTEHRIEKLNRA